MVANDEARMGGRLTFGACLFGLLLLEDARKAEADSGASQSPFHACHNRSRKSIHERCLTALRN